MSFEKTGIRDSYGNDIKKGDVIKEKVLYKKALLGNNIIMENYYIVLKNNKHEYVCYSYDWNSAVLLEEIFKDDQNTEVLYIKRQGSFYKDKELKKHFDFIDEGGYYYV